MPRKFIPENRGHPVLITLFGISCHAPDYQLLFYLQKQLSLEFERSDNFRNHSFSIFRDDNEFNYYYLIGNRSEDAILVPEFRQVDFLLLVEGPCKKAQRDYFLKEIKTIPRVLMAFEIRTETIKNFELFLNDLEMHISAISNNTKVQYTPLKK